MKEAKKKVKKSFGKSLLKVTGGILAAGTVLTMLTKDVCDKVAEKNEKEEEKEDAK